MLLRVDGFAPLVSIKLLKVHGFNRRIDFVAELLKLHLTDGFNNQDNKSTKLLELRNFN